MTSLEVNWAEPMSLYLVLFNIHTTEEGCEMVTDREQERYLPLHEIVG